MFVRCSVLEAGRSLTLAEKGGAGAEEVVAAPGFRLVATMNPGGDYGKRELSPALANRFTSVWVPPNDSLAELEAILRSHLEGRSPPALLIIQSTHRPDLGSHGGVAHSQLETTGLSRRLVVELCCTPFLGSTSKASSFLK